MKFLTAPRLRSGLASLLVSASSLFAADSVVVINEIHYHPTDVAEANEFIELHNLNGINVDISGWRLSSGVDFTFPNGSVIPGKGYVVVAKTPANFAGSYGPFVGSLSNSGETIRLRTNSDRVVDEITYGDGGSWPLATDGGGATLSKRRGTLASDSASNWTASTQAGGTPGVVNYVLPPSGTVSTSQPLQSQWKFNNSGTDLGSAWKNSSFDDASWTTGTAGFSYNGGTMYQAPPAAPSGMGYWSMHRWTGDADSLVSSTKTYTHKVDLGRTGSATVINGVSFDFQATTAVRSGTNWNLTNTGSTFTTNSTTPRNTMATNSGSYNMLKEFYYGSSNTANETLELTGLTPGQTNILTLYATGWDAREVRRVRVTTSNNGASTVLDQGSLGIGGAILFRYTYIVPASGALTVEILGINNASWHNYGFSNEVSTTALPVEVQLRPTSVSEVSSQFGTRTGVQTINGSGLDSFGNHVVAPDSNQWLSNGAATDPLPVQITYDLGISKTLNGMKIWNYNEYVTASSSDFTTRGARNVEVLVSPDSTGETFVSAGTVEVGRAYGVAAEIGQRIGFASQQTNVRRVRLNITSTWGGDNQYAGIAEIRFLEPVQNTPVPLRQKIASLWNTGVGSNGYPAAFNTTDLHWTAAPGTPTVVGVTTPLPVVSAPHPAWTASTSESNFIGFTASGTDNVPFGQFTFGTNFDLSNYIPGTEDIRLYVAVDNVLDSFKINGVSRGTISAAGFTSFVGPYAVLPPFNTGSNTMEILWTNAGTANGPGAINVKLDATAQPKPGQVLPANPITTYYRRKFNVTGNATSSFAMTLQHAIDDGAVFYLNGQEIYRTNMPAGAVAFNTLAISDLQYPELSTTIQVPSAALIINGENTLAVEVHQASVGNADAYFDASVNIFETFSTLGLDGGVQLNEIGAATATTNAAFIELKNSNASPTTLTGYKLVSESGQEMDLGSVTIPAGGTVSLTPLEYGFPAVDGTKIFLFGPSRTAPLDAIAVKTKAQARLGDEWFTPNSATPGGTNTFAFNDAIVINEIMHKQAPTYLPTGTVENPEEWFELFNKSGAAVSLEGWKIRGGVDYDFPTGTTISAGGYLVVAKDALALSAKYPAITVVGNFSGSLNSEDIIRVEDANGNRVDEVHYYGGGRWDSRANGGGSSLELRDPRSDNNQPEAWAASDEISKSQWFNVEYQGLGTPTILQDGTTSREPAGFHEFIMGLVARGEFLIDDVSVVQDPDTTPVELMQNGTFESGAATAWRLLGTHGAHNQSVVVPDPSNPAQKVLKVVASDSAEHMHNHCETTFASGTITNPAKVYRIKFRARWVSGSPRLNTRLYFNRLPKQTILPIPQNTGTPGLVNSRFTSNAGPTFAAMSHAPILPPVGLASKVTVAIQDPDGIASAVIKWRLDPGTTWETAPMAESSSGIYSGDIPGQSFGSLVQFYVEATDAAGAPVTTTFPAAGPNSGVFIRWNDNFAPTTPGHEFRFLMAKSVVDFMHSDPQAMSNHPLPATVVYQGSEVFYDASARLKSSERGRTVASRLGFYIGFDDMQKFRGVNSSINLDRSGLGLAGGPGSYGHGEISNWQFMNRAGNMPTMNNDLVYVIAPRTAQLGSAMLTMAEFNDNYLDGQYENGNDGASHKLDFIYYPTQTNNGTPEGLKIPTNDGVIGVAIPWINDPANKESYRWNFLIGNAANDDDYSGVINFNQALRVPAGPAFVSAIDAALDVDQYLRVSAAMTLTGATDHYSNAGAGQAHNMKMFTRPSDGRLVYLPWDHDYQSLASNAAVMGNADLIKITSASPAWERAFYGHLHDIMSQSFNRTYLDPWLDHFATFSTTTGDWNTIKTYVTNRTATVMADCNSKFPSVAFNIETNGGAAFTTPGPFVTLSGKAWLDILGLRLQGTTETLPVTWVTKDTWQISVPVSPGVNNVVLEGVGYTGNVVSTDSIAITVNGGVELAAASNIVVSELHYNPALPTVSENNLGYTNRDDFEWVELQNISTAIVDLSGASFTGGITYTFASGVQLAPGGRIVVPRRLAAFALRHPGVPTTATDYFVPADPTGNQFSNGGEEVALVSALQVDIKRFTYDDVSPWPTAADGAGKSLVLISPMSNPDHSNPLNWRASTADNGSPSTGDGTAFTGDANGDANNNGLSNLADFVIGSGQPPSAVLQPAGDPQMFMFTVERDAAAQATLQIEGSGDLTNVGASPWTMIGNPTLLDRQPLGGTMERLVFQVPAPSGASRYFLRAKYVTP